MDPHCRTTFLSENERKPKSPQSCRHTTHYSSTPLLRVFTGELSRSLSFREDFVFETTDPDQTVLATPGSTSHLAHLYSIDEGPSLSLCHLERRLKQLVRAQNTCEMGEESEKVQGKRHRLSLFLSFMAGKKKTRVTKAHHSYTREAQPQAHTYTPRCALPHPPPARRSASAPV